MYKGEPFAIFSTYTVDNDWFFNGLSWESNVIAAKDNTLSLGLIEGLLRKERR